LKKKCSRKHKLTWKPIEYAPKTTKFIFPMQSPIYMFYKTIFQGHGQLLHNMSFLVFTPSSLGALNSFHCQQEDFDYNDKGTWRWTKKQEKKKLTQVDGKKNPSQLYLELSLEFCKDNHKIDSSSLQQKNAKSPIWQLLKILSLELSKWHLVHINEFLFKINSIFFFFCSPQCHFFIVHVNWS